MIRLFLKTIMISLISIVLSFGDLVAFADATSGVTQAKDGSGALQRVKTFDFKKATTMDESALITMALIAVVAMKLLTVYGKWTLDAKIAAGAGTAYIIGEILNVKNTKEELNKIAASVTLRSDGKVDSSQVEYIKALKESYQKVLEGLNKKKSLLKLAFVGFTAALGVAVWGQHKLGGKHVECVTNLNQAQLRLKTCAESAPTPDMKASCVSASMKLATIAKDVIALEGKSFLIAPSLTKDLQSKEVQAKINAESVTLETTNPASSMYELALQKCKGIPDKPNTPQNASGTENGPGAGVGSETATGAGGEKGTTPSNGGVTSAAASSPLTLKFGFDPTKNNLFNSYLGEHNNQKMCDGSLSLMDTLFPSVYNNDFKLDHVIKKLTGLLIESANASQYSSILMAIIGGVVAGFAVVGRYVDTMIATPGLRSITWGFFLAMTTFSISITSSRAADVESNIKKIDGILEEMGQLKQGVKANQGSVATVNVMANASLDMGEDAILPGNEKTPCIADKTASATNACTSAVAVDSKFASMSNLPTGLATLNSQFSSILDSISNKSTIKGSTFNEMNALGNKANAILPQILAERRAIFDKARKDGVTKNTLEQFEEKFKQGLTASLDKSLKDKGLSGSSLMASISGSKLPEAPPAIDPKDGKLVAPKLIPASSGETAAAKTNDFNLKLDDSSANNQQELLANGLREGNSNDRYDMKGTEIAKDKTSIFEIISKRYYKSAMPVLLEEEKK